MKKLDELNTRDSPTEKVDFDSLPYEQRKAIIEQMQVETEQLRIRIQKSADENKRNNQS
jgi:hypothetical protein